MFTARNRQNAFAKRRRAVREAQQVDTPPSEPTAVPYDTRNEDSTGIVDAPDVSTFEPVEPGSGAAGSVTSGIDLSTLASGGVVPIPVEEQNEETTLEPGEAVIPQAVIVIDEEQRAKIDAVLNHKIPPVPVEFEPAAAPAENEPKRGRGRPRPQETIDRDNAVHALLMVADAELGITKEAIAVELGEKEQQVYSSLRQLTKEGRAQTRYVKPHGYRWFAL